MKALLFSVVCYLLVALTACRKEVPVKITKDTIEVTLNLNETYNFDLGYPCVECGTRINKQASHYSVSRISLKPDTLDLHFFYEYTPALNYTGTDEVEIELSSGSDGSGPNTQFFYKTIKFTITD